jgi:hypothetical protein
LHAAGSGKIAVGGNMDANWFPIAAMNTQAVPHGRTDAWVMTLTSEQEALDLTYSTVPLNPWGPVTMTATSYVPGTSGSVTFWDGETSLGTVPLSQGMATLSMPLPIGIRRISATLGATRSPLAVLAIPLHQTQCP